MTTDASIAAQVLEQWGAEVSALPTSNEEESDWLAVLDGCRLLVEEKVKLDDPRGLAARAAAFAEGRVHGSVLPLTPDNRISGIVRKAAAQLSSTSARVTHDLRIIWFTGIGYDAEAKHHQFMATLYGSTRVFELDRPVMRQCYFFRNGDFFRYRDYLDGAVAAHIQGSVVTLKLCLNPYSPRWEALRDSPYANRLVQGLIDPVAEEEAGEAYIADTDTSRSDEASVLRYLEKKYGLDRAMNMDMNLASAAMVMPNER